MYRHVSRSSLRFIRRANAHVPGCYSPRFSSGERESGDGSGPERIFRAPNDRKLAATNTKRGLCSRRTFFLHVDKWLLRRPLLVGGRTVERRNRDAVQSKVDTKLRDVVDHMVEAEAAEGG